MDNVPVLPESAPFTPEQRAYLNGFLAGLFSRAPVINGPFAVAAPEAPSLQPLTILFGSQTGNAENLARRIARESGKRGFAPTIHDLANYPTAQLASERNLVIVTSTYGDGEPPDNARSFWEFLRNDATPKLPQTRFSVLALGDSNYPRFCAFGKAIDARLEALGAKRVHGRVDCDVEFEEPFQKWLNGALQTLSESTTRVPCVLSPAPTSGEDRGNVGTTLREIDVPAESRRDACNAVETRAVFDRNNPFPAALASNRVLNGPGSAKDTRHFEFTLDGSELSYEVGDALGVRPQNCPLLVEELIAALNRSGDEPVPDGRGETVSLRTALLTKYEITRIPQPLLETFSERSGDALLRKLTEPRVNGELTRFLWGREIIDLLLTYPGVRFAPDEFVGLLKKLQPRLYSISSSQKAHPGRVHLTVGVVRYESLGRARKGVCSTFLAERVGAHERVPVFVHRNTNFRPPRDLEAPMIMVGPGTGIAPFRAFLEERRATGATGRNWLFFGDQRSASDFLYRDEMEGLLREGTLARLDTAFSRDQAEKIYVQQRMLENARELFEWLEAGGHFYVCGDASRMAKDVDSALHQVIANASGRTPEQAAEFVRRLQSEKRYQRDVY
jgi:sulfite reductase (NADPH) flavoprotein alpha-component